MPFGNIGFFLSISKHEGILFQPLSVGKPVGPATHSLQGHPKRLKAAPRDARYEIYFIFRWISSAVHGTI
jgi:hypothetical protein